MPNEPVVDKEVFGTGPWYKDEKGWYWVCKNGHKEYLAVYSCSTCGTDNDYARANG